MTPHTRAMIAACSFAILTGEKVAGVYDHSTGQNLKIAVECRGAMLQGFDGDRAVTFGGTLPELYDAGDKTYVSFEINGATVSGYDRSSLSSYLARVIDGLVQIYDYGENAWFAYDMQCPETAQNYHRKSKQNR